MRRGPAPILFSILVLPYGASFGYVSVALPFLATSHGVSVEAIGAVVAAAYLPHGIKFLWAPLVDTTLRQKTWYLIALALVGLGTVASAAMPLQASTLGALTAVVLLSQIGLTLMGMTCENFLAHDVPDDEKGRAAGWYQAGSFIGNGVGGGAALWLSQKLPAPWQVGGTLAVLMLACSAPLLVLAEPVQKEGRRLGRALRALGVDLKKLATSRVGLLGALVCLSPIGTGAAGNYWAAVAGSWHASADMVALVTGALGGIISGIGCLGGGWLADRMNRRVAYTVAGAFTALSGLAMAFAPRAPWSYALFTLLYSFLNGVAFAAFSSFVLETIGRGAAATKYNIFASLANLAISYVTRLDGVAHGRWGATGLLIGDAALTGAGIVVVTLVAVTLMKRGPQPALAIPIGQETPVPPSPQ
jgi:PAT family beta-lactamase induction signal transducer AmpG